LQCAEVEPGFVRDVLIRDTRIAAIETRLSPTADVEQIDAAGGALLRGLHDHHIHLFALAAARQSVACGPPEVTSADELARALAAHAEGIDPEDWLRGFGYHESVAGPLDRRALDALLPGTRPARVQHRTGAMWVLNSAALERVGAGLASWPSGVECDAQGTPTGRVYAEDAWLRERLGDASFPDLASVGRFLASCGVTGLTDATPDKDSATLAALDAAVESGALPQRVVVMGALEVTPESGTRLERGAHKVMLRESALPEFEALVSRIRAAHEQDRGVAFHCVTRAELVLAAGALRAASVHPGDRIEHASIAPDDLVAMLSELGVTVVTQPGFVYERGDVYLRDVDPADRPWLYRGRGFIEGGVSLGAGTDAPYGDADPWCAVRAAVARTTRDGHLLGEGEGLTPERALALFTSPLEAPGRVPGPLAVGDAADLCLLDRPWAPHSADLVRDHVRMTIARGRVIYTRERSAG
jgi:predicted amidohydrolase YtcJ